MPMKPTAIYLHSVLDYNSETGVFVWKLGTLAGKEAGSVAKIGYRVISINGVRYYAHRLAWVMSHFHWPKQSIDHINGNPLYNRINNLRDVSHKQNIQNRNFPNKNNSTGVLGVSVCSSTGKYKAQIQVDGKAVNLGRYRTLEQAAWARANPEEARKALRIARSGLRVA